MSLREKYLLEPGIKELETVEIEHFSGAEFLRVAVTGDLPPIDFVAVDNTPAGFNTAVLAEIGRRLHMNVELFDIDAGARAAALASGRVNAVFWYRTTQNVRQVDVPDGVILSEPYYSWNQFIYIKVRPR